MARKLHESDVIWTWSYLSFHVNQRAGFPPSWRFVLILFHFFLLFFVQELLPGQDKFARVQPSLGIQILYKHLHVTWTHGQPCLTGKVAILSYLFDDSLAKYFRICKVDWWAIVNYFHTCYWHDLWSCYKKMRCNSPQVISYGKKNDIYLIYLAVRLWISVDICILNLNNCWTIATVRKT